MSEIDELFPPVQYGMGWVLLAFGVLVALLAAAFLLIGFTRPRTTFTRRVSASSAAEAPADMLAALRGEYLDRLQGIEDRYRNGALDARAANRELSREVRAFVQDYSGFEAPVLGLQDLVAQGVHPALVDAMGRHYYPGMFRSAADLDPVAGVEAGRTVVTTWY